MQSLDLVSFCAMANLVKLCLYMAYCYERLIGVTPFEIDLETGRTRTTKKTTAYAACIQVSLLALTICYWSKPMPMSFGWNRSDSLGEVVLKILLSVRTSSVIFSLLNLWWQRRRFMGLFRDTHRLLRQHPEITELVRIGVIGKWLCVATIELFHVTLGLVLGWNKLTVSQALKIFAVAAFASINNVVTHQNYLAFAKVRGRYMLLNKELKAVISEV